MTPDHLLHLMTADLDGELPPAEVERFRAHMAASAEAREAYRRLAADRQRLRTLPRLRAPAGLRERVLAGLSAPTPATRPRPADRWTWTAVGLAAGLLIAVGVSVWSLARTTVGPAEVAVQPPIRPMPRPPVRPDPDPIDAGPPAPALPEPGPVAVARPPEPTVLDILPRPVVPDLSAFPPRLPTLPPDLVRVRVPFLAALADLDREDARQALADELGRDAAFRVDLFTKDVARGVELLQAAAREAGVSVQTDATAAERLKRRLPATYLLYAECLTPAEVGELLAKLAAADGAGPARAFEAVHVAPAGAADAKDGKDLLGIDPGLWKRPAGKGTDGKGADAPPKPVSAGTADQVARQLAGKGGDKPAVLLTLAPVTLRTAPAASREVKQFLDARGPRKPTAVPVLVVVRQAG